MMIASMTSVTQKCDCYTQVPVSFVPSPSHPGVGRTGNEAKCK